MIKYPVMIYRQNNALESINSKNYRTNSSRHRNKFKQPVQTQRLTLSSISSMSRILWLSPRCSMIFFGFRLVHLISSYCLIKNRNAQVVQIAQTMKKNTNKYIIACNQSIFISRTVFSRVKLYCHRYNINELKSIKLNIGLEHRG